MRLVGATNWFIRGPFLLEGAFKGLLGGFLSLVLCYDGYLLFRDSAGGPFGWIVANERPNLVKAIVNVEGGGAPFGNGNPWGLTTIPLAYDPPVADSSQLTSRDVTGSNGQT